MAERWEARYLKSILHLTLKNVLSLAVKNVMSLADTKECIVHLDVKNQHSNGR